MPRQTPEVNVIEGTVSHQTTTPKLVEVSLVRFIRYFLRLGTFGFGGPIALAGHISATSAKEFLAPPPSRWRLSYLHS
jgi:hypothetical protein